MIHMRISQHTPSHLHTASCRSRSSVGFLAFGKMFHYGSGELLRTLPRREMESIQLQVTRFPQGCMQRASIAGRCCRIMCPGDHQAGRFYRPDLRTKIGIAQHRTARQVAAGIRCSHISWLPMRAAVLAKINRCKRPDA